MCLPGLILLSLGFGIPERLQKMVDKELKKVFEISNLEVEPIVISQSITKDLPMEISSENFFKLKNNGLLVGYFFVDKALSKTAEFDYLVLLNSDLEIVHTKVLIYREEYGGEIGSRRWLKQFTGLTGKDRVSYGTNIDGIAGATISVRSMTISMDNLLQTIGILQQKEFF